MNQVPLAWYCSGSTSWPRGVSSYNSLRHLCVLGVSAVNFFYGHTHRRAAEYEEVAQRQILKIGQHSWLESLFVGNYTKVEFPKIQLPVVGLSVVFALAVT